MRTMDHRLLAEIALDPRVRPWIASQQSDQDLVDSLEQWITQPGNYCFTGDDGGFLVLRLDEGLYEAHTMFRPGCNGREVLRLMRESFQFMFVETDCMKVVTKVADTNEAAKHLARLAPFDLQFTREDGWGPGVDLHFMNLPLDRWADLCSTKLRAEGASFHSRIEEAKRSAGVNSPLHPEDPDHDQAVGLASLMFKAGNPMKAVTIYNRWAVFAGYVPLRIVWNNPTVVHTGDAVIQIRNGDMEVLLCQ